MNVSFTALSRFFLKSTAFAVIVMVLFSGSFPLIALRPQPVFAQAEEEPCPPGDTSDKCNEQVGGVNITVQDVQAAIDAPTPNLANTTAYIFFTLSVLMTGTFDPNYTTEEGPQPLNTSVTYPSNLSDALHKRGALGGVTYLTAEMIKRPPASAQTYVADLFQNSKFGAGPVYAQGIGFGALTPILGTWKAFRDVAYYLLTIMFLITGFLILIRHKVSGNMAVTVQNALPRLVITLILITFSYAIAGLIVDLMFLSIYFIVNVFDGRIFESGSVFTLFNIGPLGDKRTAAELALDTHIFTFTLGYIFNSAGSVAGVNGGSNFSAWSAAESLGDMVWQMVSGIGIFGKLADVANTMTFGLFENILQVIFMLIFGIALLIAMFRTFFALLMSYAGFVINVVLSPLILLPGAIPGKDPFYGWVKNLVAGLAPFVVAIFMIFMSLALTGVNTPPGVGYDEENPGQSGLRLPLILTSEIDAGAFIGILGMGFMLLLPEAVKMTKSLVGAKGGPFDEFKDAALNNFKQGWTGSGMMPGAKGIVKTGAIATGGAAAGSVVGGAGGALYGYNAARGMGKSGLTSAFTGAATGLAGSVAGGIVGGAAYPTTKVAMYGINKGSQILEKGKKIDTQVAEAQAWFRQQQAKNNANAKAAPTNPATGAGPNNPTQVAP